MIRFVTAFGILAITSVLYFAPNAHAGPVVGFNAGKIIEDSVFVNKNAMNPTQIQQFLNTKVSICDTWGTQPSEFGGGTRRQWAEARGYPAPYPCLKDYTENGKSSAQIIHEVAQEFSINPQVLIVLLQKEQGLVTDTWPLPGQYRTATGYGCPDTAPCDSQYFGLTNQLRWSGRMFRAIMNASPTWYTPYVLGNNYIQYNPEGVCGGSSVNIQNRSTQALYNYTPYQPNQGALDAGYGSAHCGAYGNRNFYLYMNEWFGGFLISTVDNGNLYIRGTGTRYYRIADYAQYVGLGLQHLKVYETTSSYLANLTPAGNLTPAVTFGANGNVFAIDSGARRYYSYATYQAYGQPEISSLAEGIDGQIPNGPALTDIVTQHNIGTIYVVSNSKKRHITRESYIADGYSNTYVSWMSGYFVNGMTQGPPVASAGTVLRTSDTNQYSVLKADRSTRQLIDPSLVGSLTMGSYSDTSGVINQIPIAQSSSAMKITAKDSSDNLYLVDGNTKLHLTSSQLTSIGKTAGEFVLADPSFLARLTTTSYTPQQLLTWIGNDGKVYRSEQGELVHIQSLADFNRLSYSFEQVARLSTNTATQLFSASNRSLLLSGTLFNVDGGARVYVSDRSNNIRAIPTSDLFATDLGLSWGSVRTINQQTFNHYSKSPDMTNIMTGPDGTHWMISLGVRYKLTQALLDEYDPAGLRNAEIDSVIINSSKQGKDASRFIRIGDDARVYYIDDGGKIPLGSVDAFSSRGGTDWNQVLSLSAQAASIFETSQTVY